MLRPSLRKSPPRASRMSMVPCRHPQPWGTAGNPCQPCVRSGILQVVVNQNNNSLFNYFGKSGDGRKRHRDLGWNRRDHTIVNPIGLGGVDLTGAGVQDSFFLTVPFSDAPTRRRSRSTPTRPMSLRRRWRSRAFSLNLLQRLKFSDFAALPGASAANFAKRGRSYLCAQSGIPFPGLDYELHNISTIGPPCSRKICLSTSRAASTREADQRYG